MDQALFTLPILAGQTGTARAFLDALDSERKGEFDTSQQRLRVIKEVWAIQQLPDGDTLVAYIQGEDIGRAFQQFAASQDAFDLWFKQQLKATTGADLNTPPPGPMSEILSDYEAASS